MTLEELRKEIQHTDEKMAELFQRRMDLVSEVAHIKKKVGIPVSNPALEEEKFGKLLEGIKDEYREPARTFFQSVFKISRNYQETVIK